MKVTYLQKYTYTLAKMGYNLCVTGDAGTGKTFIMNKFIQDMEKDGYNIMKLSATGIAASSIGGVTIHKEFKVPVGPVTNKVTAYKDTDDAMIETDILVIEELSMCRVDLFDLVISKVLTANSIRHRRGHRSIQIILIGDFFQLPPVLTEYDKKVLDAYYGHDIGCGFAFQSKFWSLLDLKYIILTDIMRQTDKEFLTELNKIRVGNKESIDYFYKNSARDVIPDAITLCGTNSEVDRINTEKLNKILGDFVEYRAILDGEVNYNDTIAEFNLRLKPGARVMMLTNSDFYNNGSFGVVAGLADDYISVLLDTGVKVDVERYTWEVYRYKVEEDATSNKSKVTRECIGTLEQFPVKLAYAITIHKSQGQTYDKVNISPYCWDCGQLYTALSRVKNIANMHLNYDVNSSYAVTSLNVIKFYNEMVKVANQDLSKLDEKPNEPVNKNDEDVEKIQNLLKGISC